MEDLGNLEKRLAERLLPWDRFSSWVHGVCVVTFDLELGQAMETLYPGSVQLTEADKTNICYLAFPDSNSGVMGDSQFHFRVRLSGKNASSSGAPSSASSTSSSGGGDPSSSASASATVRTTKKRAASGHLAQSRIHAEYNRRCPTALQFDPDFLFGFAYFRQVRDPSIRRGYYQKSVILLTKLPLVTLFGSAVCVIARKFFDQGEVALEVACSDVDRWSLPLPGHSLELPLLGSLFQVHLPSHSTRSVESGTETVTFSPLTAGELLPSVYETDLFTCLLPVVEHIHALWELVLSAEPVVVMASTPALSSSTVQFLTGIIYPLSYCADYRPYATIHDSDFKEITGSNTGALPAIMLGVTNPFFGKALDGWPHIVRLGDQSQHQVPRSPSHRQANNKVKASTKFKLDGKPGVYSQTKPFLERDKAIVKRILKGVQLKRPAEVQSALIRRHFLELTQTFMIPLERYLASLMPLAKNVSPYRAVPKVKPFNAEEFLASLDNCGPQLTSTLKGDWQGLYRRFFRSPNFVGWYNQRHREVSQKLRLLHLESLAEAKIEYWMRDKEEVQLVDMVLRIRGKLDGESREEVPDVVAERLQAHVDTILSTLPEDLRAVLDKKQKKKHPSSSSQQQQGDEKAPTSPAPMEQEEAAAAASAKGAE